MKKSLLISLLGLAATAMTTFGQGTITLDNYNTSTGDLLYGQAGIPLNGQSGTTGTAGHQIVGNPTGTSPWTVGLYYVVGDQTGSIAADPSHVADPLTLGGGLTLGTGVGSTAGINDVRTPSQPGEYLSGSAFAVPGTAATGGNTVTIMLVAFSGTTYDSSQYRGHSTAFTLVTTANTALQASQTGNGNVAGFSVFIVPEPSLFALSGIGVTALVMFRRKK